MPTTKVPASSLFDISETYRRAAGRLRRTKAAARPAKRAAKPKRAVRGVAPVAVRGRRVTTKALLQKLGVQQQRGVWRTTPHLKHKRPSAAARAAIPTTLRAMHMFREVEGVKLVPTVSSNVASFGYNKANALLYVQFHGGGVYKYYHVPENVWLRFQSAPSRGKFLWSDIRDVYAYERIA